MPHGKAEPKRQEAPASQVPASKRVSYHPSLREQWNREAAELSVRAHPGLTVEEALEMIEDLGF